MKRKVLIMTGTAAVLALVCLSGVFYSAIAQQPQIPTLQVCNQTKVVGKATVAIARRSDATHTGSFTVSIELSCAPSGYPAGTLTIGSISMSDSVVQNAVSAATFEQVTSTGKQTPAAYLNGRCKADNIRGCRFWMTLADNKTAEEKGTPDVIGFLILDGAGNRVAYGTGPVVKGDIAVTPTSY